MLVVTRAQALRCRTAREVDALVRAGHWLALRRGVYLTAPELPGDPAVRAAVEVQACVLATSVRCVGSHESAALVHELPLFTPYVGPVLASRFRESRRDRPNAQQSARLVSQVAEQDATVVHGAPITTLARTAVDLARSRPPLTAAVVLDAALRAGASRDQLEDVLTRQRGWPGSVIAGRRVAFADALAESPLESIGRLRFAQLELPPPRLQVVVGNLDGAVGRVDFLWDEQRTVGEADGRVKYLEDVSALFEEKRREDAIRDGGYEVFRFTWDEAVSRPRVLEQRALRSFARSARRRE